MRKFWIIIFLLNFSVDSKSQEKQDINPVVYSFPNDWLGKWTGNLEIYNEKGWVQSVPMQVEHLMTDTSGVYIWALIYGEDTISGRRDYYLKTIDAERGHYVIDEKNSIFLDAYVLQNKLISNFEVGSNYLSSVYTTYGNEMIFEIFISESAAVRISGDTEFELQNIPQVKSYKTTGYHRAVLHRN